MLTPREKSPLPENVPRGVSNPRHCGSEPKHYQLSYSGPLNQFQSHASHPTTLNMDRFQSQATYPAILYMDQFQACQPIQPSSYEPVSKPVNLSSHPVTNQFQSQSTYPAILSRTSFKASQPIQPSSHEPVSKPDINPAIFYMDQFQSQTTHPAIF